MINLDVRNCWAAFGDEGEIRLPLAAFESTFKVNELPAAKVTPALGRSLMDGSQTGLAEVKRGMKAELFLDVTGVAGNGQQLDGARKILSGWVQSIGMSDTSTVSSRWLGAEIGIVHKAAKLAGSPAASYTFAGAHTGTALEPTLNRAWDTSPLRNNRGINSQLFPLNRLLLDVFGRSEADAGALFPTTLLRLMIVALVSGSEIAGGEGSESKGPEGVFTQEEIEDMVKDYDPANLAHFIEWLGGGYGIAESMLERYEAQWQTQNLWQAILTTAQYMQLTILPFNEGFYIANPLGWLQEPDLRISSQEYTSLRQSATAKLSEPVNGVVISIPPLYFKDRTTGRRETIDNDKATLNYFYPPLVDSKGRVTSRSRGLIGGTIQAGMYYHWRSLPAWLYATSIRQHGSLEFNSSRKSQVRKEKPPNDLAQYMDEVGYQAAQAVYAQMLSEQAAASLIFPYREDLMPGTVVRIENAPGQTMADTSFIGETLYGIVNNVKVYCSTVQENPILQIEAQVTHLRGQTDNEEPPDGVALTEVPIYQDRWVGMDLFGELLQDAPEGNQPGKIPKASYNTAAGGLNPVVTQVESLQL